MLSISFSSTTTSTCFSTSYTATFSTLVPQLVSSQGPGTSPEQDLGDDVGQGLVALVAWPKESGKQGWVTYDMAYCNGPWLFSKTAYFMGHTIESELWSE